jgi:hypothetical protein
LLEAPNFIPRQGIYQNRYDHPARQEVPLQHLAATMQYRTTR